MPRSNAVKPSSRPRTTQPRPNTSPMEMLSNFGQAVRAGEFGRVLGINSPQPIGASRPAAAQPGAAAGFGQGIQTLAQQAARQALAQPQNNNPYTPPTPFQLPQASADPAAPTYARPAAAPRYQDQAYTSPNLRYSEAQLAAALGNEFALMAQASRSAAQDQMSVETNRARNQRILQGDALATQRYMADVQAGIQNQAIANQRSTQQNAFTNQLTGLQFQQGAIAAQTPGYSDQMLNRARITPSSASSRTTTSGTVPREQFVTVRGPTGTIQVRASEAIRYQTGGGGGSAAYDPTAFAREQLAANAARQAADLAARERMQAAQLGTQKELQGQSLAAQAARQAAELQTKQSMQGADLAYRREAPQLQANADDELRRRAAMRALQAFNQSSSGRRINLANDGRV